MAEKLYRAILIDPEQQQISVEEIDGSLQSIHALVGTDALDSFRIAEFGNDSWDYGWVDDTGLQRGEPIHAFLFGISTDPIAGRCLLVGISKETRDICDASFDIGVLRGEVTWLGRIKPEVHWDKTTDAHGNSVDRAIVMYEKLP
jgi:hypothetical protein